MRNSTEVCVIVSAFAILFGAFKFSLAEDTVSDAGNAEPQVKEDLYFDESEVEIICIENTVICDPKNTPHIVGLCYYERDCPRHLTKSSIAKAFAGDAKAIAKYTGRFVARRPIPKVEVEKSACDKLRKLVENDRTQLVESAQAWTGFLTSEAQCDVLLKGMAGSDLYHRKYE